MEIVLTSETHKLCTDVDGHPIREGTNFLVWDSENQQLLQLPDGLELREFFGIASPTTSNLSTEHSLISDSTEKEPPESSAVSKEAAATWKDENAVRSLIIIWKDHQPLFQSAAIRNDTVWKKVADKLKSVNPTWIYSGIQCENKFKDVRKKYVKTRDHNQQTGAEQKTCKFFEEMEEALGDKPCVKPVSIASSLKRHRSAIPVVQDSSDDEVEHSEPEQKKKKPGFRKNCMSGPPAYELMQKDEKN